MALFLSLWQRFNTYALALSVLLHKHKRYLSRIFLMMKIKRKTGNLKAKRERYSLGRERWAVKLCWIVMQIKRIHTVHTQRFIGCGMVSFFATIFLKNKNKTATETKENMLTALKWFELCTRRPIFTERHTHTHTSIVRQVKSPSWAASISSTKIMNNIYYYVHWLQPYTYTCGWAGLTANKTKKRKKKQEQKR